MHPAEPPAKSKEKRQQYSLQTLSDLTQLFLTVLPVVPSTWSLHLIKKKKVYLAQACTSSFCRSASQPYIMHMNP